MTLAFRWFCLLIVLLVLSGCGQDQSTSDNQPPSAPRPQIIRAEPVPASSDDRHWARITWYGNPEPDVAGYRVWRVPEFVSISQRYVIKDLHVGPGADFEPGRALCSWVDQGDTTNGNPLNQLQPDPVTGESRGFYWYLEAYDESGNRSGFSDPIYYRLINNPRNLTVGRVSPNSYRANWQYANNPDVMIDYCTLRVYPLWLGPDSTVKFQQDHIYQADCSSSLDFSEVLRPMITDCTYVLQLDVTSSLPAPGQHADTTRAGSAVFATFTYRN
jgi:hypothetical protein